MKIGDRLISPDAPPFVIAELGVNHDGSLERALALVDAAATAQADAIKLQLFTPERLLSRAARLASYQRATGAKDLHDLLDGLALDIDRMTAILERAHERGLFTLVTVFSIEDVPGAAALPVDAFKTASPDLINRPLLAALRETGHPLVVSTGASTLDEVARAATWLEGHPHVLMHCVSSYPTPDEAAALGGRLAMMAVSPFALGYSDHTMSVDTGAYAVAGGACMLEKHLTWDPDAPGPDHAASLDADGFAEYVRLARRAWRMRGPFEKAPSSLEEDVRTASRQSLTTTRELAAGHVLERTDLTVKRPGTGLSPAFLDAVVGCRLRAPVDADMPLTEGHLA